MRFAILIAMLPAALNADAGFLQGQSPGSQPAATRPSRVTVGAIRWDAWFGNTGVVGKAVHRSLGPAKWHDRLPFYARVKGDEDIEIDGTPQVIIDREIEYASAAGIDYWAFVTYAADDSMSIVLRRYLASPLQSKVNFCLITECVRWKSPGFADRVVKLMVEPGYHRVVDGRPLLYLGFISDDKLESVAGIDGLRKKVDSVRVAVADRGLPNPYVVIMDFYPPHGRKWLDALGADAISSYAVGPRAGAVPYAEMAASAEQFWNACRDTGASVVPIVMTGWDPRPRVERPMPWGSPYGKREGEVNRSLPGKPGEIANHLNSALKWLDAHAEAAPARTVIVYAWNEFDEGGWLAPTLVEGTARLDAVAQVLRPGRRTNGSRW